MHDDRAREGLVHLQAAALELIAAGRAFLDVAEELVREPAALGALLQVVTMPQPQPQRKPKSPSADDDGRAEDESVNGVTRIRVT